jgi:transcriptional regulator with XRE-family HTH domain
VSKSNAAEASREAPDLKTFQGRLRWARARRGYGSRELAKMAGLSDATVSSIETGIRRDVTLDTAFSLAQALDVPPEWLAWGRGSHGIPPA